MTKLISVNGEAMSSAHDDVVELLDTVLDLAARGEVQSVAVVMVTGPGEFRISAAGDDLDGMLAGAKAVARELQPLIDARKPKTVIHKP